MACFSFKIKDNRTQFDFVCISSSFFEIPFSGPFWKSVFQILFPLHDNKERHRRESVCRGRCPSHFLSLITNSLQISADHLELLNLRVLAQEGSTFVLIRSPPSIQFLISRLISKKCGNKPSHIFPLPSNSFTEKNLPDQAGRVCDLVPFSKILTSNEHDFSILTGFSSVTGPDISGSPFCKYVPA